MLQLKINDFVNRLKQNALINYFDRFACKIVQILVVVSNKILLLFF